MAEARAKERWAHTSSLMALIANAHRDPKKGRAFRPDDFNPYAPGPARAGGIPIRADSIGLLKRLVKGEKR